MKRLLFVIACLVGAAPIWAESPLHPARLTCEYLETPLGIAETHPRLSWNFFSDRRNERQTAYELLVSDRADDITQHRGNQWTTGKVASSENINIVYGGAPLKPFTRYYWSVRTYDKDGNASAWSAPSWFETAMLNADDWHAAWIGDARKQFDRPEDFYGDDPMPLFRKIFTVTKKVAAARLYVCGLGYGEAYLNGRKVSDHLLDPGWTTFSQQALYVTHDITSLLRPGANAVGFMLGNGWYNPLPLALFGQFNLRNVQQTGRPCVKAQLLLTYADGSTETLATDASWQTTTGPVVRNNVYLGEHYDARLEKLQWADPNTTAGAWSNAVVVTGPDGRLSPQMQPPVRVTTVLKPASVTEVGRDTFIVDMGRNFAGVARIHVKGPRGTKISLRYGEALLSDGRLNYLTTTAGHIKEIWNLRGGPGAPKTAWQQDEYILKGAGREEWAPRFTFHALRYVEVTGWPGGPTVNDIEGLRMNADLSENGTFSCSNDMFNRLQEAVRWTFLSNVFSVQSDCPGREKLGYGADMVVTSEAFLYNYDMSAFYRKSVQDFANEQRPDGAITETAPYAGIADRGYGGDSGPLGWELAFPYLQKELYEFYGDKRVIEENFERLQQQLAFLKTKEVSGLFHWDIGDHEALDPRAEAFSAASFYYHHAALASEFAGILQRRDDSLKYAALAANIRNLIIRKYLVPGTGRFDNATQSAQLFALWYRFSPEDSLTMKVLMDEYARHDWHLSTGIFATKMMFDVMRRTGQNEVAYRVANQRSFPGWGYMLEQGATTLWESWAKPDNATTFDHPMFGSVSEWFYRSLLGINPSAPGFEKIEIRPQPAGDLKWAKGSYLSVRGRIASEWSKNDNAFALKVSIPPNTIADIWIPAKDSSAITENGKSLGAQGLRVSTYRDGYALVEVGSGNYDFSAR